MNLTVKERRKRSNENKRKAGLTQKNYFLDQLSIEIIAKTKKAHNLTNDEAISLIIHSFEESV